MIVNKDFIGEQSICDRVFRYYVISKPQCYGVAIEAEKELEIESDSVYFTEDREFAYTVAKRINKGCVTLITMTEIIDEMIA